MSAFCQKLIGFHSKFGHPSRRRQHKALDLIALMPHRDIYSMRKKQNNFNQNIPIKYL